MKAVLTFFDATSIISIGTTFFSQEMSQEVANLLFMTNMQPKIFVVIFEDAASVVIGVAMHFFNCCDKLQPKSHFQYYVLTVLDLFFLYGKI